MIVRFQILVLSSLALSVGAVDFEREIEPIFVEHCADCHGAETQKGQFRLDRLANLLRGGNSGEAAIVPGDAEGSFLYKVIRHKEPKREMPPKGDPLTIPEIALIEQWIAEGAKTPERYGPAAEAVALTHWSFLPVKRPDSSPDIDEFIQHQLKEKGLSPSPEADRPTLIRRLYLVMTGLPPTPDEVARFVADSRPDAWSRLVEEVLASPRYGERIATFWLDLVRFGETNGFETNRERPNAWRFRDWVIDSFNRDKPYDQFVREQIAGDALGDLVATGFLVAGPYDVVKSPDPKLGIMQRMNELDDMINTTGTAFLGLTTGCARCHNHKFDPISQKDYYAMQAIFAGVQHGDSALPRPTEMQKQLAVLDEKIAVLTKQLIPFLPKDRYAAVMIDDAEAEPLFEKQGGATELGGEEANPGGSGYTWWSNRPGEDTLIYRPQVRGPHRIWLSWGAGFANHSPKARYLLQTAEGRKEIAIIDQRRLAGGTEEPANRKLWSGWFDAGVHELSPGDVLVLQGGEGGSAVTADRVCFDPVDASTVDASTVDASTIDASTVDASTVDAVTQAAAAPSFRSPVDPLRNAEILAPRPARFVRFTIDKSSSGQPCIDELEVYSGGKNVALASNGAKVTSSGDFEHPSHKLAHLNDGQYGNARSWISAQGKGGWVQIEFPAAVSIDRIEWGRDRDGKYNDRLATSYRIEAALEPGQWALVAGSSDRLPQGGKPVAGGGYDFTGHPEARAKQGRVWEATLLAARAERVPLAEPSLTYAGTFKQPAAVHRLYRGEPDLKREEVGPDAITVFASLGLAADAPEQQRRRAFADWVTSGKNPLTARVIANRIWQFHFGSGIVDTPSDFGKNGTAPTHPELLDWLATEMMENGWSLKHLHRLILNSDTWRQDNKPRSEAIPVDAASRLLWRFPSRRLEAEGVRDNILAASGKLDLETSGGPGFSAFVVEAENVRHYHPKDKYGPEDWRRMIYMTKVRQEKDQVFGAFDCPDASQAVPKRSRSTTPLQALNLLNSQFVMEQAGFFAKRLESEAPTTEGRVERAFALCFQRPPSADELADARAFITQEGIVQFSRAMLNANEFVFIP